MKEDKILVIEDDKAWISNYQRWLKHESFEIDIARSATKAIERLRTTYYALVILDLSLDPNNPNNRDSIQVQEYLKKHPEGTLHIIVSAVANRDDVRRAGFEYNALNVFFKDEFEDLTKFKKEIKNGIKQSRQQRPNFKELTYEKMIGDQERPMFEHRMLKSLKPRDGAGGYLAFMDKLLDIVRPLELHKTRNEVDIVNDKFVFALYWSRRLGSGISLCIVNSSVEEKVKKEAMSDWLGWVPEKEWRLIEANDIKGYIHLEDGLSPNDFILPTLK